jgi:dihydrofolate reductase
VYSTTLPPEAVVTSRTRLERRFDPAAVRDMKASAAADLAVGGSTHAGHAFRSGLIDECHLVIAPVVVGGGKRALPDGVRLDLDLVDERRFGGGMVFLRYVMRP